jgi:hypothetical protein
MAPTNRRPPSAAKLQREVSAWTHPVGTPVVYVRDDGTALPTKTRTAAQILGGHSAVIWLEDVSGCVLLERVKPVAAGA